MSLQIARPLLTFAKVFFEDHHQTLPLENGAMMMTPKNVLPRKRIAEFIDHLYEGDLHAKRVLSLSNATLGVLVSASLAVHTIGQGMAQALGKLSKHGVKQVDRLLSNQGIDVWAFFGYWVPYLVGGPARKSWWRWIGRASRRTDKTRWCCRC